MAAAACAVTQLTGIDDHNPAGVDMQLIGYRGQHIGQGCEWPAWFVEGQRHGGKRCRRSKA